MVTLRPWGLPLGIRVPNAALVVFRPVVNGWLVGFEYIDGEGRCCRRVSFFERKGDFRLQVERYGTGRFGRQRSCWEGWTGRGRGTGLIVELAFLWR